MKKEKKTNIKSKEVTVRKFGKGENPFPVISKEEEVKIFKSLAHLSFKEAAKRSCLKELEPDASDSRLVNMVMSISRKIRKAPEIWGLSQDAISIVNEALSSRSLRKNPKEFQETMLIKDNSFQDKLLEMRDTVADMIQKKLKKYNSSKGIDNVQLKDLKELFAVVIDKSRLLKGESTENIIRVSKVDTEHMTPEDALNVVMKAREALIEGKK